MSTSFLKALPGKLDTKRHSPSIGLNIFISLIQIDMQDIYTYNNNL